MKLSQNIQSKRVTVLGIGFDPLTQAEVVQTIATVLRARPRRKSFRLVKPYVEFFRTAASDKAVSEAITSADLVVADGVSIQWAAAYIYGSDHGTMAFWRGLFTKLQDAKWRQSVLPGRGAGVDATHQLLLEAAQRGWRVGILGGPKDSVATRLALEERYPVLQLVNVWSGYFKPSSEKHLVRTIAAADLDILFVAIGHPRQELFMQAHVSDGLARVLVGEGGTFDYDQMGGRLRRAPAWMRRLGLEWLWRVLLQPSRIKRQLAILPFLWNVYLAGSKESD